MLFDRLDEKMVRTLLETLPMEITVIDNKDEVVGWNRHEKRLFKRPLTSMGLNFRDCHPRESLAKVEQIVDEMKKGKRDKARFWIDLQVDPKAKKKNKILIEFFALRDYDGTYLGCMECTQDVEEIRHLEGQKRVLDMF